MSVIRFVLILLATTLMVPELQARQAKLLVLGDSLSAAYAMPEERGWVALLAQRLTTEDQGVVVNASVSGETTAGGLSRLPALLNEHKPDILAIQLGANDGLRGLPIAQIEQNIAAMIELGRAAGAQVLLLGIELPVNFGPRYRGQLRAVYADLAQRQGTALVPFLLEGVALDPLLIQDDGLHPNASAQPVILDTVWPALRPLFQQATAVVD